MGESDLSQLQAKLDLLEALLAKLDAVWGIDNLVDICVDEPGDYVLVLEHLIEVAREHDPRCLWSPTGKPDFPRCVRNKGHKGKHRYWDGGDGGSTHD